MIGTYRGQGVDAYGYSLIGQTAQLRGDGPIVKAQFDDNDTGLGRGWYAYSRADFDIRNEREDDDE